MHFWIPLLDRCYVIIIYDIQSPLGLSLLPSIGIVVIVTQQLIRTAAQTLNSECNYYQSRSAALARRMIFARNCLGFGSRFRKYANPIQLQRSESARKRRKTEERDGPNYREDEL